MDNKNQVLLRICEALSEGNKEKASLIARTEYPFEKLSPVGRKYKELESTQIFIRDGFVDRYSGARLLFPGVLRLLSHLLPREFPAHPNWKMSESHIVYWELFPTVDHIVPIARGGEDNESNWATTSMLRNSAKSNWTLTELGWHLLPPGDSKQWNGLIEWFIEYLKNNPQYFEDAYIKRWHKAAIRAMKIL